ncbi:PPE family protein [Mycobacterium botniense]|uniref:Putative PPE family protein PPE30 n=1 Tax=Mycobacterium botniense TaxID=84962 RepID=A0A7I9Y379_9MYCO|nr:PPE family protein [Mycobacterium botniense]GFG76511.1 putative PPE family protein PPE30 [Mycobacterium botniense]
MDYATLPPEINSARIYTGAGSGPLLAAAAAWDGLAAELRSTAASYSSVVSGLTAAWRGPSSVSMAAAATPYVAWLITTAAQAEQTASQARAAAAAYQTAFAATVPPPVIAANRAELASLIATNIFGQNTAAIAANEARYAGMWAQDSAAMYTYAAQSAAAATLSPFDPPAPMTSQAAAAGQAGAVAHATALSAGTNTPSLLSQLTTATPGALQSLAGPAGIADTPSPLSSLTGLLSSLNSSPLATIAANVETIPKAILVANDALITTIMGLVIGGRSLSDIAVGAGSAAGPALAGGLGPTVPVVGTGSAVSASVGQAGFISGLAVPPSWAAATPAIRTVAAVLSGTSHGAVPATAVSQGSLVSGMALAGMAGGALGTAASRAVTNGSTKGRGAPIKERKNLKDGDSPQTLRRIVAAMAEKPDTVQHWHTDSEHLDGLLAELRKKPGIHAVHVKGGTAKMKPPKSQSL